MDKFFDFVYLCALIAIYPACILSDIFGGRETERNTIYVQFFWGKLWSK